MSEGKKENEGNQLKEKLLRFGTITLATMIGLVLAPRVADWLVSILFNEGLMYYEQSKSFATVAIVGIWLMMSIMIIIEKENVEKEAKA